MTRLRIPPHLVRFAALFLLLLAIRVPFYFTHHIQEDAYISLRCAQNLAETGVYGFNAGEKVSASTSHLYVFLATLVRLLVGENAFIPVMQVVNSILFLFGTWFLARTLLKEAGRALWLWVLLSSIPLALLASYSGMETSLLVFIIGGVLYLNLRTGSKWMVWIRLALLPWVRPDAIAFALLMVIWNSLRHKRVMWGGVAAVFIGLGSLLLFNQLYFGAFLHQSINAKLLMRHPFSPGRFADNLATVFIGQAGGMFSPIRSKFFDPLGVLFVMIILASIFIYLWRQREERLYLIGGLSAASMALAVPVAYAFGGVLYQWYFWPSALIGACFPLALIVDWSAGRAVWSRVLRWGTVMAVIAGVLAQMAFSYAWGTREFAYRGGIGIWLKEHAKPNSRMLLEPAGYIPYFSGIYTYDEVGLVSPQVVTYREAYNLRWWPEFVMDYRPDWLVQRGHIAEFETYQGYVLNDEERDWFQENYRLETRFSFNPIDYTKSPFLKGLLTLGEADDYYIYKRVK